ncbi:MAG: bifunctional 5,10-methylenetetrahydrofolate dehydrogenase/5,10-methenyltetrahydrofolate cyclohydrolase [Erysipelotrichaceae bacterium]|jgi:methylenetetrahydrofolate dehydrogenase (NADP+)/methenyltetrahydrofolate cyclohydrolase
MANILYGKAVSDSISEKTRKTVQALKNKGKDISLAILRVGEKADDLSYEKAAIRRCEKLGINVKTIALNSDVEYDHFYQILDSLNKDDSIDGILMLRPLPKHLDNEKARNYLNPAKDIDGGSDLALSSLFNNTDKYFAPCTAQAVIEMLKYYDIALTGKRAVVIGRSLVVGKPVGMLLLNENCTVTICHSKSEDIASLTKKADIIVACSGQMESLNKDYFSPDQTVIDVGINYNHQKKKLCGDVLFDEVKEIVENISPVPKGVGSVTIAVLLNNLAISAKRKL